MTGIVAAALAVGGAVAASPPAPVLLKDAFRQSPVRAEPGDVMMIAGSGFASGDRVAYKLVSDTTNVPAHPASIQTPNTADSGEATVVLNASDALTIQLPSVMTPNQSYVFWVKTSSGRWSGGVLINDARPLWISPERVFASASFAGLARQLKVVGRNLQKATTSSATCVRLTKPSPNPESWLLNAQDDGSATTAIERYAAIVTLPTTMSAGTFSVDVNRNGCAPSTGWVHLAGQNLTVSPDPGGATVFLVQSNCGLVGDHDDSTCVAKAINDAANAGGGNVVLGPGTWDFGMFGNPAPDSTYGLIVPQGVSIVGSGSNVTTIRRGASWNANPVFTLLGSNEIKNVRFQDTVSHTVADAGGPRMESFIQIGYTSSSSSWGDPTVIDTVMIDGNVFDNAVECIREGGFPIRHLYIVNNEFGGYLDGILFAGPYYNQTTQARFNLQDSIISGNTFKPGGYYNPNSTPTTGSIGSEIGASSRVDFSNNVADGRQTATDYLYGAPSGFRAGFFFHMSNNHEMMLFSKNTGYCTGDRAGDGEFVDYDNNANEFGFASAALVTSASSSSVTVSGTLQVATPADYYATHWLQIVEGPGIGQARKITSYSVSGGQVTFNVDHPWDVQPVADDRVTVAREVWQVQTVDNTVDNTAGSAACRLASGDPDYTSRPRSGGIQVWAVAADSAIEGNVQTATNGIMLQSAYAIAPDVPDQSLKQFVDVRGNTVTGEVNYGSYCSTSGIQLSYGASEGSSSPVTSYGVSVGHNVISQADSVRGGAIAIADTGFTPAIGYPMWVNSLIFSNTIQNIGNDHPTATNGDGTDPCEWGFPWQHRRGIHLHGYATGYAPPNDYEGWGVARTVLAGNVYPSGLVCQFLDDETTGAVNLDTPPAGGWCPTP